MLRTLTRGASVLLLLVLGLARAAEAETYPDRPITLIIPFAPAGGTDSAARILAPILSNKLGATVVIENLGGAAGNIGTTRVARATPDGYTLLMHNVAFAINATMYHGLPFDVLRDFVPIAFVNYSPLVIVGRTSLVPRNMHELVEWMRDNHATVAHPGLGSIGHMALVPLLAVGKDKVDLLPYRGGGPALQDVIAGHVDLMAATLQAVLGPVQGGLVRAYAVTSAVASPILPEVQSIETELGPKSGSTFWNILAAPAQTPPKVIAKLSAAVDEALSDRQVVESFAKMGIIIYPAEQRTPEGALKLLRSEIEHWAAMVRENKLEMP